MERPSWAPIEVDIEQPSVARVYDCYLGGSHNFAADRLMAQQVIDVMPELPLIMHANRAFLRRAVRELVARGITQFLDIGSGIPTVGNVHEVAAEANPRARVVYVDCDPVAVAHSRALLDGHPRATVVQADVRDPAALLAQPELTRMLDLNQPVGILMVAVLHFLAEADDPIRVVRTLREAVRSGSYLVVTHAGATRRADRVADLYARSPMPLILRSRAEVAALFEGFTLLEPGVVPLPRWRPESPHTPGEDMVEFPGFGGVGRAG